MSKFIRLIRWLWHDSPLVVLGYSVIVPLIAWSLVLCLNKRDFNGAIFFLLILCDTGLMTWMDMNVADKLAHLEKPKNERDDLAPPQ